MLFTLKRLNYHFDEENMISWRSISNVREKLSRISRKQKFYRVTIIEFRFPDLPKKKFNIQEGQKDFFVRCPSRSFANLFKSDHEKLFKVALSALNFHMQVLNFLSVIHSPFMRHESAVRELCEVNAKELQPHEWQSSLSREQTNIEFHLTSSRLQFWSVI